MYYFSVLKQISFIVNSFFIKLILSNVAHNQKEIFMDFCFHRTQIQTVFVGPFQDGQNTIIELAKHGDVVTFHMPAVIGEPSNTGQLQAFSASAVPAEYRPSIEVNVPIGIISDDSYQKHAGEIRIRTTGLIEISCSLDNETLFGTADKNGWKSVSLTYISDL